MTVPNLPEMFTSGSPPTIFPTYTTKERRLVSIFISVLTRVGPLAHFMLKECEIRTWKTAKWEAFTEVTLASDRSRKIDGYVSTRYGTSKLSALVEAKVGTNLLEKEQISRYMKIAKENSIDAMITISNQRVLHPSNHFLKISKTLTRDVNLVHWSWSYIETQCRLFRQQNPNLTDEQKLVLGEFIDMISNPKSGSSRYDRMPNGWESVVDDIVLDNKLGNISDFAEGWIQEQQDIALELSKKADAYVTISLEKKHRENYNLFKDYISSSMDKCHCLEATFVIPNAADKLHLVVDIKNKTVSASMTLKVSAENKNKTLQGHVSQISKMIESRDKRIYIEPKFKYKSSNILPLADFKDNWKQIFNKEIKSNAKLTSFKIMIFEKIGKHFSSNIHFIRRVDRAVSNFYDIVGKNLKKY